MSKANRFPRRHFRTFKDRKAEEYRDRQKEPAADHLAAVDEILDQALGPRIAHPMNDDIKELLSALNAENVRYLIVGAHAIAFHTQPRPPQDLDLFIASDLANANALFRALTIFGAEPEGVTASDFRNPETFFRVDTPPHVVDIRNCSTHPLGEKHFCINGQ